MPYLNLDLDYFTHPKIMRLVGLLGKDSAVLPIRLWCYVGKYHSTNGSLAGYSPQEIESIVNWWGKQGQMVEAMVKVGLLSEIKGGYEVKDWLGHQGHLKMFKERAQTAANKRWGVSNAISNANDGVQAIPRTVPTVPNQTNNTMSHRTPTPKTPQAEITQQISKLYKEKTGQVYHDTNKDYVIIARLINKHGMPIVLEKLKCLAVRCELRDIFFTKDDGWRAFTPSSLIAHWNRLIEVPDKLSPTKEKLLKYFQKDVINNAERNIDA